MGGRQGRFGLRCSRESSAEQAVSGGCTSPRSTQHEMPWEASVCLTVCCTQLLRPLPAPVTWSLITARVFSSAASLCVSVSHSSCRMALDSCS